MKLFQVMRKTLREAWREPQLTLLLLVFPALLVLIYFYGYGQSGQGMSQMLSIQVVNHDPGALGAGLVEDIRAAQFDGKPIFKVALASNRAEAEVALREGQAGLILEIPSEFSQALLSSPRTPARLTLVGDPASDLYVFSQSFLTGETRAFVDREVGWNQPDPVTWSFVPGTGKLSDFQFGVPGLLVFGILFGTLSTGLFMVREETHGTLKRLRLTRLGSFELLAGVMAAQAALALPQMAIALGTAVLCGLQTSGNLLLVAFLGILVSLIASGCGFLTACLAHNDGEAANLSMIFIIPLAFLSGAVFPLPAAPLFQIGGRVFQIYDLLPTAHATNALRRVIIYGDGLAQVGLETAILLVSAVIYLWVGAWVYRKLKLR